MPKFAELNYQRVVDFYGSVHKAGCSDITKDKRENYGTVTLVEAESAQVVAEAWAKELNESGFEGDPWGPECLKIYGCCRNAT